MVQRMQQVTITETEKKNFFFNKKSFRKQGQKSCDKCFLFRSKEFVETTYNNVCVYYKCTYILHSMIMFEDEEEEEEEEKKSFELENIHIKFIRIQHTRVYVLRQSTI